MSRHVHRIRADFQQIVGTHKVSPQILYSNPPDSSRKMYVIIFILSSTNKKEQVSQSFPSDLLVPHNSGIMIAHKSWVLVAFERWGLISFQCWMLRSCQIWVLSSCQSWVLRTHQIWVLRTHKGEALNLIPSQSGSSRITKVPTVLVTVNLKLQMNFIFINLYLL